MLCPNCKKELADNALTCPECGYSFISEQYKKGCGLTIGFIVILAIAIGAAINWLIS